MATPTEYLNSVLDIDGAIGAAVVDYDSGITLGTIGGGSLDMELEANLQLDTSPDEDMF
jgi:hypothetical protein